MFAFKRGGMILLELNGALVRLVSSGWGCIREHSYSEKRNEGVSEIPTGGLVS